MRKQQKTRILALGLIKNKNGQILLQKALDPQKNHVFYRPLGGRVDFQELASDALKREILEELGLVVLVNKLLGTLENIFEFNGTPGHEIIFLFECVFENESYNSRESIDFVELKHKGRKAVWRSPFQIKVEGAKLYPLGLENFI